MTVRNRAIAIAAGAAALLLTVGGAQAQTSTPAPALSAIGNELILWISVSPAYARTGTVVVSSGPLSGCSQTTPDCKHIWVTHDGGHSWSRAKAQGWTGVNPEIAVDSTGREVLYGTANPKVLRSDDDGNTWTQVGPSGGTPTPAPTYGKDQALAVAGTADYVLRGTQLQTVVGSGGAMGDTFFAYSPSLPAGNPPALLGGIDRASRLPAVQHCTAALICTGTVTLSGTGKTPGPPNLYLSSDFGNDGTVFAQTASDVFKSTNGGSSFTRLSVGVSGASRTATTMMALAPGYREHGPVRTAYVAVMQATTKRVGGLYRTTDGGATWSKVGSPGPFDDGALAVAAAPDGRLFASYLNAHMQGGLLCSADGGTTWHPACAVAGSNATTRSGGPVASGAHAGGATPTSAAAATNGALPGTGGPAGTAGDSNFAGSHGGSGRPWLLLLIVAVVLAAGAGVVSLMRRRTTARSGEL